jgi:hypothetical protein
MMSGAGAKERTGSSKEQISFASTDPLSLAVFSCSLCATFRSPIAHRKGIPNSRLSLIPRDPTIRARAPSSEIGYVGLYLMPAVCQGMPL